MIVGRSSAPNTQVPRCFALPPLPPHPIPYSMAQDPPSSDSESDGSGGLEEYQYESDAEEKLADTARALLRESGGNYRREWSPRTLDLL